MKYLFMSRISISIQGSKFVQGARKKKENILLLDIMITDKYVY